MTSDTPPIAAQGVATLPDEAWAQARHRTEMGFGEQWNQKPT